MQPEKTTTADRTTRLTFQPENVTVEAEAGDTILDAALDNHIALEHECGGNCACTTCHVKIVSGAEYLSPMEEAEADRLAFAENRTSASRLGCQAILHSSNVVVEIVSEMNKRV